MKHSRAIGDEIYFWDIHWRLDGFFRYSDFREKTKKILIGFFSVDFIFKARLV